MRDQYFVLLVAACFVMGCQSKTENPESTQKKSTDGSSLVQSETQGSEDDTESKPLSPSEAVARTTTAEPHEVCRTFLDLLKSDETAQAQQLFTRKAMSLTLRHDMPLGFPGELDAKVELTPAKFATAKQEVCQVMCKITDKVDGVETESELGWVLKKANDGWRIAGVLLPLEDGKPMDFLSFESSTDLVRVKTLMEGEPRVAELQLKPGASTSTN